MTETFYPAHPKGEVQLSGESAVVVETFGGRVHVEWDPQAAVTAMGQLPFFIEFLKSAELFEPWVEDCPMGYSSPNAPSKRDVLGTILLSVLAGHKRYAHITSIRSDSVNPELLRMRKVVSEDSVRRAFGNVDEGACAQWQVASRCFATLTRRTRSVLQSRRRRPGYTTGGHCLSAWPFPRNTRRRSAAAHFCYMPWARKRSTLVKPM